MEMLRTATGKTFDVVSVTTLPDVRMAYLRIANSNLANVASVFGNPAETVKLWYEGSYMANYTRLDAIIPEGNIIRVNLRKE